MRTQILNQMKSKKQKKVERLLQILLETNKQSLVKSFAELLIDEVLEHPESPVKCCALCHNQLSGQILQDHKSYKVSDAQGLNGLNQASHHTHNRTAQNKNQGLSEDSLEEFYKRF